MARTRRQAGAGARIVGVIRLDRAALLRGTALQSVFMLSLMIPQTGALAQPANARPQGGVVSAGAASIASTANTTAITQSSQNAAINWSSFNLGSAQAVKIAAPNSRSVTVNRVAAGNPSQIAGQISDNGVFVLTNPSGVVFAKGAQVTASSVLITTAGISNQNLMAGQMVFDQPGKPGAMIVNKGQITVKQAGLAALVAPGVANSGTISAPMGRVALAGAEAAVVDLYGDGLMSVDVTKQVATVPTGRNGKPVDALITNTGVIAASGGKVLLTASAIDGIVTNLVDAGGKISANTAKNGQAGTIVMNGVGGSLTIEGDVSAAGKAPGATGGSIELNADNAVNLAPTARVSASGRAGGGTVAIGTSLARAAVGPSVTGAPTAKATSIAAGAVVSASATRKGNGGKVTVLSTDQTTMAGSIAAKGGPSGGDGGIVEVSGHKGFALTGAVDVSATKGLAGSILLDPDYLTVVNGTAGNGTADPTLSGNNKVVAGDNAGGTDTVTNAQIAALSGNITLQAGISLAVANSAPITLQPNASLLLTTQSGNITTGTLSPITASGSGGVSIIAGTSAGSTASITLGSSIKTDSTGTIALQSTGGIALGTVSLNTGVLDLKGAGSAGISQGQAGTIGPAATGGLTLISSSSVAGPVSLAGTANAVSTLGSFATTGAFSLVNATPLTVTASVGGGSVVSVTAPSLTLGDGTNAGTLIASANGSVSVQTGTLLAGASPGNGTLSASGGTVEIAPYGGTSDVLAVGITSSSGTLGFDPTAIALTARTLSLGSNNGTVAAGSIVIGGTAAADFTGFGTLGLSASGAVTQTASLLAKTLTGKAGSFALTTAGNTVTALGGISAGSFSLTNAAPTLTVAGILGATTSVAISNTGSLLVPGTIKASSGTALAVSLTGGTVVSVAGLINTGTAGSATLTASSGSIAVAGATVNTGSLILAAGTGGIAFSGGETLSAGTLDLSATGGGVTQDAGGTIAATTLLSGNGVTGTVDLAGAANNVGTVGAFAVTSGGFTLIVDSSFPTLAVTGPLSAASVLLDDSQGATTGGTIFIAGALTGTNAVTLNSSTGGIVDGGTGTVTTATLLGNANGFVFLNDGFHNIGTLGAAASPFTATNQVFQLSNAGSLTVAGLTANTTSIQAGGALTVTGPILSTAGVSLSASGNVLVTSTVAATTNLSVASHGTLVLVDGATNAGTLIAGTGKTISVSADTFLAGTAGGVLNAGTGVVEIAPYAATVLALGTLSSAGTLGFTPGSFAITANTLRLGSEHGSAPVAGIIVAGTAATDVSAFGTLDLRSTGTVTQGAALTAAALTGSVAAVSLTGSNTIASLAGLLASGSLVLNDTATLTVTGSNGGGSLVALTAPSIAIGTGATAGIVAAGSSGAIGLRTDALTAGSAGGTISAAGGVIEIAPSTGSILALGTVSSGGTLGFTPSAFSLTAGALRLGAVAGTVIATGIEVVGATDVHAIGTLDLQTTGSVTQTASLIAGTLTGTAASVTLFTAGNTIGAIGNFGAAGGFSLQNNASLAVSGQLNVNSGLVALADGSSALSIPGGITAASATISAGSLDISGSLGVTGLAFLGASGNLTAGGVVNVGTLTGHVTGSATLAGTNAIGVLGSFTAGPSLILADTGSLLVGGSVVATTLASISAQTLTASGFVGAPSTTLTASSGTLTLSGTVNAPTAISLSGSAGIAGDTGTLLGGGALTATSGGGAVILTSGSNAVASVAGSARGAFSLTDGTALNVGSVTAGTAATLTAPSLTVSGGLIAADAVLTATAGSLSVPGTITDSAGATLSASGLLLVGGAIAPSGGTTLTAVSLTGGTISVSGLVSDGGSGTTGLFATGAGTIDASVGTLVIGTLSGSAGAAGLTGTNSIATLASFAAAKLGLNDGAGLTVSGPVAIGTSVAILDSGRLLVSGTIAPTAGTTAIAVGLTAATLSVTGLLSDGGAGSTGLFLNTGTVTETGSMTAGTLTGTAGAASLSGTNAIASINGFRVAQAFTLTDGTALTVLGTVGGGSTVSVYGPSLTLGNGAASGELYAPGGRISVRTGTLVTAGTQYGTLSAHLGTLEVAPFGTADTVALGTVSAAGTLGFVPSSFSIDVATLSIGANNGTVASGNIVVGGASPTDLRNVATLDLRTTGSVTQTAALDANLVVGSADSVSLTNAGNTIATVGTFNTTTGFDVTNNQSVTVTGLLTNNSGTVVINTGTFGIDVAGTIAGTMAVLSGSSVDIPGTIAVGNGIASITAVSGNINEHSGTVIAGTLTGGASGTADFSGSNTIGTLGNFSAGALVLNPGTAPLNVAGVVSLGTSVSITKTGSLLVSGTIAPLTGTTAIAVGLTAGTIGLTGLVSDGGNGTTTLIASGGTVTQTGTLISGTMTGTASVASLTGTTATANQVANLGRFSAGALTLNDGQALTITSTVSIGNSIAVTDSGLLTVNGSIAPSGTSAIGISLTGGTIAIPTGGLVGDGGTGTTGLFATNAGTITENGQLIVGTLTGSAGVANLIDPPPNQIGTLGSFTAGSLVLNDSTSLAVIGPVSIGTFVSITDTALLLVSGTIAPIAGSVIAVGLTAATLTVSGTVSDSGSGTTALFATNAGTVSETGTLIAGSLSGTAGVAILSGTSNAIAVLTSFAAGSTLVAFDAAPLLISGSVTAGTLVSVTAPTVNASSVVTAPNTTLAATAGTLTIGGTVSASATAALSGSLGIAGAAGLIQTGSLIAASSGGSVILSNGSNAVGSVTGSAHAVFNLGDSQSLNVGNVTAGTVATIMAPSVTVSGSLAAASATLTATTGSLSVPGTIADSVGATLSANGLLLVGGTIAANGTTATALTLTGAMITLPGTVSDGGAGTTALFATNAGTISATGNLTAGTLSGTADLISLSGSANTIAGIGTLAGAHGVSLTDAAPLSVSGTLTSGSGTVAVNTGTFGLNVPGTITGLAATLAAGSIAIGGSLGVSGVASLLANLGSINETGFLNAATLTGSAASGASFSGTNAIGVLAAFSAPAGFSLTDGTTLAVTGAVSSNSGTVVINDGTFALSVPGAVTGNAATLSAGSIDIGGSLAVSGTASLAATGQITEGGGLSAATVTGSAGTSASFTGTNTIGALGSFAAGSSLILSDTGSLLVNGSVTAGTFASVSVPTLTIASFVSAPTAVLTASTGALTLTGTVNAPSILTLSGTAGIAGNTGTVLGDGTLVANSGGAILLGDTANSIALVTGSAGAAFTLGDSATLTVGNITAGTTATIGAPAIGITGTITAPSVAVTANTGSLALSGVIDPSSDATLTAAGLLTIGGTIAPPSGAVAVSLTGGTIGIAGTVSDGGTGTTGLFASNAGTITETGRLTVGTLRGSADIANLTGSANVVHTLGNFTATHGFDLIDASALSVSGVLASNSGTVLINTGTFGLGVPGTGTITGLAATLSAGSIDIGGSLGVSGIADLLANVGSIGETGVLRADTLTGSVVTTGSFSGTNAISTLAAFTAPSGLILNDGTNLTVSGSVVSNSGTVVITDGTFALAIPGAITALAATLSAGSIDIGGSLGVNGTASLAATGQITEGGFLNAATLTGSAGTIAAFSGTNSIGTLASFSAPSGFSLNDLSNLTVSGTLGGANGAVIINDGTSTLTQHGTITANSLTLTAASITSDGTVLVTNTASFASTGTISDTGMLNAGTLTGGGTVASFSGGNTIITLAAFTAPNGLTLNDNGNLNVTGSVASNNGTVTITDTGATLTVPGTIQALGAVISAQSIGIAGTLAVTNIASLAAPGGITETNVLNAGTLTGSSSGIASFTGTNTVGTIEVFSATNGFTLMNLASLSVAGVVSSGGTIAINDGTFALGVPGTIAGGAASLTAGAITIGGTLSAPGGASLFSGGTIGATGLVVASTLTGSAAATAIFSDVSNSVTVLSDFSAANGFTLANAHSLSVAGVVAASGGTIGINNGTFAVGVPGTIRGLAATIASGDLSIGGTVSVTNTASLGSSGSITATGLLSGGTIALTSAQNIDESTGTLVAYQVTGSSGNAVSGVANASVDLSGTTGAVFNNQIQTLGAFTTNTRGATDGSIGSDLTVTDGRALSVTGAVQATAGNVTVTLPGTTSTLTVTSTGSVIATNAVSGGVPSKGNVTIATNAAITVDGTIAGGKGSTVSITPDAAGAGTRAALTVENAGLISVQTYIPIAGSPHLVQPGTILLRTDNLVLNSAGTAVSAPDGLVMIAPRATGDSISLDPTTSNTATDLSLSAATLRAISTAGTLSAGLPGVGEVLLGSFDGVHSNVTGITVTGSIVMPSIRTLALFSNGTVAEAGSGAIAVNALAGYGTTLLLGTGANAIGGLGVATQISSGGQTYASALSAASQAVLSNFEVTSGTGNIRVHNTSGTLDVVGTLIAGTSQTIDLASPGLVIDATQANGLFNNGALIVGGSVQAPGQILLAADSLRIVSATATPIVSAIEGMVAITPFTASHSISIDNTASSTSTDLSLGVGDLALIQTRTAGDTATAALGSQTLMIGSQNGGASPPDSGITVNAALNLDGGTGVVANTLALYSTGSIAGSGVITVDTLTGRAGVLLSGSVAASAADILLTGNNAIGTIGAVVAAGSLSSGDLIASGAINVVDAGNLVQRVNTTVQAGDDPNATTPHNNAQLTVRTGTLAVGGTIQGGIDGVSIGNVGLYAGSIVNGTTIAAAGLVTLASTSSIYASSYGGVLVNAAGNIVLDGVIWGGRSSGNLAGSVTLIAAGNITEASNPAASTRGIGTNLLTGSAGGHAALLGDGSPTQNRIVDLGAFTTNLNGGNDPAGFQLRDGRSLTVTGAVTDADAGVSIAVAPPNGTGGFASGDIVVASVISANTVAKLQATGNIFESSGGAINAGTLTAAAGIVPATETASGGQIANNAVVFLGGTNQVATLANLTATGNVLLYDGRDLNVTGTVLGGIGTGASAAGTVSGAVSGPFGTTPTAVPSPFIEIDVIRAGGAASGNLTIASGAVVHAGIDDPVDGNVTLRAGNASVAGSVLVNGGVYASSGGTVSVSAGFTPTGSYNTVASGSNITINGTLAGDQNGLAAASVLNLNAAGSIDEAVASAVIAATVLSGHAGGHANLSEAANGAPASAASGNRIANLASFVTNAGTDDPQGFVLRDGAGLTVTGPVTDRGASASRGISIAVAPGSGAGYTAADLVLNGVVSAKTTVNLQATGNVYEQAGGTVVAATLLSQAGLVPGTESGGALSPTVAVDFLGGINQIGTLGNITATGNILVDNGQDLVVAGAVTGGTLGGTGTSPAGATAGAFGTAPASGPAPFVEIDVVKSGAATSGNLTVGSGAVIHAGADGALTGYVTLRAGSDSVAGSVTVNGEIFAADGGSVNVTAGYNPVSGAYNAVGSGSSVTLNGTIWGDQTGGTVAGLVNLAAASSIDEPVAGAAIGTSVLTGHAGGHANLSEAAAGGLAATASANRIATLGAFATNTGTDDPQGLLLRDGQALTVTGPVTDAGASASRGVSIAVVPGAGAGYTAANLVIGGEVSAATTVGLQSTGSIVEQGAGMIVAGTLTSQAGVIPSTEATGNAAGQFPAAITLANAPDYLGLAVNRVGVLGSVTATGTFTLYDVLGLTVSGTVLGGITPEASVVTGGTLIGTGVSIVAPGTIDVTGTINVASQDGILALDAATVDFSGNASPTLRAATIEIVASSGVSVGNGMMIYTGGDVFKRPGASVAPVDPGVNTAGAHFRVGPAGWTQTGLLTIQAFVAATAAGAVGTTHPELDVRLTSGTGAIAFDPPLGLSASSTSLLVTLGTSGTVSGNINADDIALFYSGTFGIATSIFGTLHTASGTAVSDTSAASQAFISRDGIYVPSNHFQVNGCAISSVNCVLVSPFSAVPVVNPLRDLPSEFVGDEGDDPDLLVPNVSDRDD